ncbi:MAG: type I glyceraldehyde-3-phosphate dehydrogenase [Bdellovibrionota bacterium]|nr:type I glyceraldehyde-3-phosphate dehydrogenase [Deltaproteobacteria bacterium]
MRIAINGFGRIGRNLFRILHQASESIEVVAINDLMTPEQMRYLLQYDTILGRFPENISVDDNILVTSKGQSKIFHEKNITDLPWKDLGIDIVVESTGVFGKREQLEQHITAGASRVLLTVPAKDAIDATIVMGVNDTELQKEHKIISNASCTTNCLAPIAKIIHQNFGIQQAFMTTTHAYTNDQRVIDMVHSDPRRGRAAAQNIIPTTTGAAAAVGKIIPELNGKIDGIALRVPVVNGSIVDLTVTVEKDVTAEQINQAVKKAAQTDMANIVEYCEDPIVSSDVLQNPHSSIFDSIATKTLGSKMVKILSWYDNEWGYSNRLKDLIVRLSSF